jgi:sugar lactone lactonase YvrE
MKRYKLKNIIIAAISVLPALILSSCSKSSTVQPLPTAISTAGVVTTIAGNGQTGSGNGTGTAASFYYPQGVAIDAAGNLFVADQGNNQIRKISTKGTVTTLAGTLVAGNTNVSATTIGVAALFNGPTGVAVDGTGNVYVADFGNNLVRKIAPTGVVTTLAGSGKTGSTNAAGTGASFNGPAGVAVDKAGNVYVADFNNNLIRQITPAGVVTTLAGSGKAGNINGTGTAASFNGPRSVAVDLAGNVYVADANNNLIREIMPGGVVTTLAGTDAAGNKSGAATAATFSYPSGVAVDGAGNVYVADANNNLIREISAGTVTSIAGSGYLILTSPFSAPVGVAADAAGNVYVANDYGNLIQKVTH